MNCAAFDELAAAYALSAVEPAEERELSEHLATCEQPHREARDLVDWGAILGASVDAVEPSTGLRDRVIATVTATPQEHRPVADPVATTRPLVALPAQEPWWRRSVSPMAIAAVAVAVAIGIGAWSISLRQDVADRDDAIRAIATAERVHQVSGSAGSGLLVESDGEAIFLADGLADLPEGQLYELWLIGADGAPVAVGTLDETDGLVMVTLEQQIGTATTFAVTVEPERVDAPTTDPVLAAALEG